MTHPTPEQSAALAREQAIQRAEDDSTAIAQLLDSPGWTYFARRLRERRQSLRDAIADNDALADSETRTMRALAREYTDLLDLPLRDRVIHLATLANARRKDHGPARG